MIRNVKLFSCHSVGPVNSNRERWRGHRLACSSPGLCWEFSSSVSRWKESCRESNRRRRRMRGPVRAPSTSILSWTSECPIIFMALLLSHRCILPCNRPVVWKRGAHPSDSVCCCNGMLLVKSNLQVWAGKLRFYQFAFVSHNLFIKYSGLVFHGSRRARPKLFYPQCFYVLVYFRMQPIALYFKLGEHFSHRGMLFFHLFSSGSKWRGKQI